MNISLALSWIRLPFECSPFEWLESDRPSAMMLFERVMRCEVLVRHASVVLPQSKSVLEVERFS